jgi:flagellar hook protein FlgE
MGLFGAMTSAVSGLQAQAFAMQNISGNIANSQTLAYKGIDTSFEEMIPGVTVASQQTSGGVMATSVGTNGVQGAIQNASSSTAMAINGDGYFVVQSPVGFAGNTPNFSGVENYTRRGDFSLDAQGYLVNGSGYYLEGTPIDPATGNPVGTTATPLQFQSNFLPANPTTTITYGLNLPETPQTAAFSSSVPNSELINPADFTTGHDPTTSGGGVVIGSDASTFLNESVDGGSVTVYTANGTPTNLQLRWAKTDSIGNGGSDTWNLFYQTDSAATGTNPAWQNVGTNFVFDSTGQLSPAINSVALSGVTVNGVSLGNISLNSSAGAITQFASTNGTPTVNNMQQNGYAAGQLQTISVSNAGIISGTFTNGQTIALADVPLVHFNSPNNLITLNGGAYQATVDSGQALAGATGKIVGQSLEGSNTDIATEFTKLIVTQQAYSANTKVITTANQMSQDLMNILR